jgi:hypothetical protein
VEGAFAVDFAEDDDLLVVGLTDDDAGEFHADHSVILT